jgi:hypothetical protein
MEKCTKKEKILWYFASKGFESNLVYEKDLESI